MQINKLLIWKEDRGLYSLLIHKIERVKYSVYKMLQIVEID